MSPPVTFLAILTFVTIAVMSYFMSYFDDKTFSRRASINFVNKKKGGLTK